MTGRIFNVHRGVAAPLMRANIDTDAIIPSREMKRVSKLGLGKSLFAGWRYQNGDSKLGLNPEFILNQREYANTSVLITGANMGCGSSREFAVWALVDFGIRAIIAPSFGSIFHTNCVRNGLLPIVLDKIAVNTLAGQVEKDPQGHQLEIDLSACTVNGPDGNTYDFKIAPANRQMLLQGLDAIDVTLKSVDAIDRFLLKDRVRRSWSYLD